MKRCIRRWRLSASPARGVDDSSGRIKFLLGVCFHCCSQYIRGFGFVPAFLLLLLAACVCAEVQVRGRAGALGACAYDGRPVTVTRDPPRVRWPSCTPETAMCVVAMCVRLASLSQVFFFCFC